MLLRQGLQTRVNYFLSEGLYATGCSTLNLIAINNPRLIGFGARGRNRTGTIAMIEGF